FTRALIKQEGSIVNILIPRKKAFRQRYALSKRKQCMRKHGRKCLWKQKYRSNHMVRTKVDNLTMVQSNGSNPIQGTYNE
uniref:60S ribosomal protein L36 n=1 Tax=Mesocestoides corti TaxID=53468 RepID=A0A5K3EN10_MESCO